MDVPTVLSDLKSAAIKIPQKAGTPLDEQEREEIAMSGDLAGPAREGGFCAPVLISACRSRCIFCARFVHIAGWICAFSRAVI